MNDKDMMRIGDSDRELVSRLLKTAVDEGKLSLPEYDERLQHVLQAKTVGDLTPVTGDLIGGDSVALSVPETALDKPATPASRTRKRDGTPQWVHWMWFGWSVPVAVCTVIWLIAYVTGDGDTPFWPVWVAGPPGAALLCVTGMERFLIRPALRERDLNRTQPHE